jgi:hypothetical protein
VFFQIWYRILNQFGLLNSVHFSKQDLLLGTDFFAIPFIVPTPKYSEGNTFQFLNLSKSFEGSINWNEQEYGKLWNYNLQYLDCINQSDITKDTALSIIASFCQALQLGIIQNEPYPASLRIFNLIKFIHRTNQDNAIVTKLLFQQIQYLNTHKEYHILGNHLLENAFALVAAALVTQNKQLYNSASQLLLTELDEQILEDGAHFERSAMYHCILLERLLDCISLLEKNNTNQTKPFKEFLVKKAELMLGWLKVICFQNGDIPLFNDAAYGISAQPKELFNYALKLQLQPITIQLNESGYRKFCSAHFETIIDVCGIEPSYQPGHAHADSTSFICYVKQLPFLVETGTSTYQIGAVRSNERSSAAHNVVVVNQTNSADVWGGFRVGKRPLVTIKSETEQTICLTHNAYRKFGVKQFQRQFQLSNQLIILDEVRASKPLHSVIAYFHFHPSVLPQLDVQKLIINTSVADLNFEGASKIELESYPYAEAFNQTQPALRAKVHFQTKLQTIISIKP